MNYNDEFMLSLTVAQFKAFKRGVQLLCRAGITYSKAVEILVNALTDARIQRSEGLYK